MFDQLPLHNLCSISFKSCYFDVSEFYPMYRTLNYEGREYLPDLFPEPI